MTDLKCFDVCKQIDLDRDSFTLFSYKPQLLPVLLFKILEMLKVFQFLLLNICHGLNHVHILRCWFLFDHSFCRPGKENRLQFFMIDNSSELKVL